VNFVDSFNIWLPHRIRTLILVSQVVIENPEMLVAHAALVTNYLLASILILSRPLKKHTPNFLLQKIAREAFQTYIRLLEALK
jgi:hypothetical protein